MSTLDIPGPETPGRSTSGPGIFFDGIAGARHTVTVELDHGGAVVRGVTDGDILARWPYDELEPMSAPAGMLRLGRAGSPLAARLEIRDAAFASAIKAAASGLERRTRENRRGRLKVIVWSIAATVSLLVLGIVGVPAVASRLTPLIPFAAEHKLGRAVETQVRQMLDNKTGKPFECGNARSEQPGRAALDKLVGRLEAAAALPIPLQVTVARRSEANAFALPGGTIYLFEGLIDKVERPDELAGVIAHEIGHVAHRDGTRSVLQSAGLSFLFGMVLGDFVGGGAVIIAARSVLGSAYSREVETEADAFSVQLMNRVGRDGRALGVILDRIAGAIEPGVQLLADHPLTKARIVAIDQIATPGGGAALLDRPEWTALKRICTGG
jgi:Zn-dependent protease with chaperone function